MSKNEKEIPRSIKSYQIEKKTYKLSNMNLFTATNTDINEKVLLEILPKEKIKSNPNEVTLMNNHAFLMKLLNHKNILKLYEIIETKTHIFLVYEYFKGMKLSDYISLKKGLKEDEAISIFKEILSTLVYLHDMYICNLNINTNNIIIDPLNNIKICDFKFGHFYTSQERYRIWAIGDSHSTCPELHSKKPYNPELADIWSCGVVLYHMLTGHLPFEEKNELEVVRLIIKGDYTMPENLSPDMKNLLKGLLEKEEEKRFKINELFNKPVLEDKNITKNSLAQGLNLLTTKYPVDPIVLNLCSNIFKIDEKKITNDLENNNFTPITSLFNQIVTKLKNKNIKTINDLYSNKFISYLNNQENCLSQEEQLNNIQNYILKEDEIKRLSQGVTAKILNDFYDISNGLDNIKRQYRQEKKGIPLIKRKSSFDIVKNSRRTYTLNEASTDNDGDNERAEDFSKFKRNTVVLQGLKGIDINKIAFMANKNKNNVPGGRFTNMKDGNIIEEANEEKSGSERSRSKDSNNDENEVTELRRTISELVKTNNYLQKDLNNAKCELFKKNSEIEEKSVKAERNKNQRAELQLIKVKNDKALKEKDNEINELKKKLEEKEAEISKKSGGNDSELKSNIEKKDNEINELKKKLEEKEVEINKKLEEKENELNDLKKKLEEKDNEINQLKKNLEDKNNESPKNEENQSDNNKKLEEKDNEINELKKNLEQKDNEINDLKKKFEEKDKIISELNNKGDKESSNNNESYEKKIEDLTNQLNAANSELNELKNKSNNTNLEEKQDDTTSQLKNELEESKKLVEKLKEEIKDYESKLESSKVSGGDAGMEELKKENKNMEEEIIKVKTELGKTKCDLANTVYEKEMFEAKYKKYVEKLEGKLISLGFKLKHKQK